MENIFCAVLFAEIRKSSTANPFLFLLEKILKQLRLDRDLKIGIQTFISFLSAKSLSGGNHEIFE